MVEGEKRQGWITIGREEERGEERTKDELLRRSKHVQ